MNATVIAMATCVAFTAARCIGCDNVVMTIPGFVVCQVLKRDERPRAPVAPNRGRVVRCYRCGTMQEVVEHGT